MNIETGLQRVNKLKKFTLLGLLIYLLFYYLLLVLLRQNYAYKASDLMSPLGIILSLTILFNVIQLHASQSAKKIWVIIFLGTIAFLLGDLQRGYDEVFRGQISIGSTSDIYYAISGILILIAYYLHIPHKSRFSALRSGFDVIIIMFLYFSLEAEYILMPVIHNVVLDNMDKFAALMYPIFDAGLFIAILLLYFNDDHEKEYFRSGIMLIIACIWLLADQALSVEYILGIYQTGYWLDPLWPGAFFGLSWVGLRSAEFYLHSADSRPIGASVKNKKFGLNTRIYLTYGSMILLMFIWCCTFFNKSPINIAEIIVMFLLILRYFFSMLENRRLMDLLLKANKDLQEAKVRIEYELRTDYLTRLFNRRYIDRAVADLQKSTIDESSPFSVLVLDVDHFKNINDSYGHSTGDQVLKQIAEIIRLNVRKDDIAARWGGEEFIVILPHTDESLAFTIGERIRSEIEQCPFQSDISHVNIKLSASIGVTEAASFEKDFSQVLLRADQGMYEAKYAGRNRTVVKRIS